MKIIDILDFNKMIANNDMVMLEGKKLVDNGFFNQKYAEIYSKYRYGLEIYLNNLLNIEKIDNDLCNSKYAYNVVREEDKDFYQKNSYLPFKYIYLRNNLYIERLTDLDLEKIYMVDISKDEDMNLLLELIKKTYPLVIAELYDNGDNVFISLGRYGDDTTTMVQNKSIVYGIRYDEFNNSEKLGEKWLDNFFDQHEHLNRLVILMKEQIYIKTGVEVNFIFFNNYNV